MDSLITTQISFKTFKSFKSSGALRIELKRLRYRSSRMTALCGFEDLENFQRATRSLSEDKQQKVKELVRHNLPMDNRGIVSYPERVNAVRGACRVKSVLEGNLMRYRAGGQVPHMSAARGSRGSHGLRIPQLKRSNEVVSVSRSPSVDRLNRRHRNRRSTTEVQ